MTGVESAISESEEDLSPNGTVSIYIGKLEKGEVRFGCGMDMITGKSNVRQKPHPHSRPNNRSGAAAFARRSCSRTTMKISATTICAARVCVLG